MLKYFCTDMRRGRGLIFAGLGNAQWCSTRTGPEAEYYPCRYLDNLMSQSLVQSRLWYFFDRVEAFLVFLSMENSYRVGFVIVAEAGEE
jgi:hypothetical protein